MILVSSTVIPPISFFSLLLGVFSRCYLINADHPKAHHANSTKIAPFGFFCGLRALFPHGAGLLPLLSCFPLLATPPPFILSPIFLFPLDEFFFTCLLPPLSQRVLFSQDEGVFGVSDFFFF